MGLLSRLIRRRRGVLAVEQSNNADDEVTPPLLRPRPTAGTQRPQAPEETPTTRPLAGPQPTAGTRKYGPPGGTPSTERLHNPIHHGR